jgi:hypothetical protein
MKQATKKSAASGIELFLGSWLGGEAVPVSRETLRRGREVSLAAKC